MQLRPLSKELSASPQIVIADIAVLAAQGFRSIINNRPEGEAEDQTPGRDIEAAAHAAGMTYVAIPIIPGSFGESEVCAMATARNQANGKVLAYCRTGTRSTLLWVLAEASGGKPIDAIAWAASAAGYDVSPVLPMMADLAARAGA